MQRVVFVGSPNVGKSALFHALTGFYVVVSNYPGTTTGVARARGKIEGRDVCVIDTPGIYGIPPVTADEEIALNALQGADVIVQVVTARGLGRMLALTRWLKLTGIPVVIAVNMMDEAEIFGLCVEFALLRELTGCAVAGCSALKNYGIDSLRREVARALEQRLPRDRVLDEGWSGEKGAFRQQHFLSWGLAVAKSAVSEGMQVEQRLDRLLLHPLWGYVIALLVFYAGCILFVGGFWAGWVVDVLDQIYQSTMGPWLVAATASIPWPWVGRLLWGEFGLVALGLRYAVMIILPIVTGFFCVFSLLEDSGYLPRLAALTDRLLRPLGLGGSAAMPLVLGLGCTTMATVFTRILPAARDRTITILLLALVVPCSAQMGVITGLLSRFPVALLIWGGTIGVVAVIAARVASIFSGGSSPPLVQELPPLRTPRAKNVAAKVFSRVKWYGVEVLPLLLIVCAGAWLLDEAGIMSLFERGAVVLAGFARLPPDVAPALMLGFFRRDYGAAGLFAIRDQLTVAELCVACILLTLLFPCVAQFVVMVRERGVGMGIGMAVAVFVTAVVVASLMGWLLIGGL